MKIIAELWIVPLGVGISLSKYIAECERILKKRGLTIQLHAEGTNIEGDISEVLDAIKTCIEAVHKMGAPRVLANVKISSRTDKTQTLEDKVKSVENLL